MSERDLSKELKKALIELKEEIKNNRCKDTKMFLKTWAKIVFIQVLIFLIFKCVLGLNLSIVHSILGFLSACIVITLILLFLKLKTGNIMGINYFKYAKEKVMLDIEMELCVIYIEMGCMLINEDKFMPVEIFTKVKSKKEKLNIFLEYIESKEYINIKKNLELTSSDTAKLLALEEQKFKKKIQDLLLLEGLTEKELNKMSL